MIVTCPKCHEQVMLPGGVSPNARVRCPLCQEDYLLSEAMDRLPPALQILDPGEPVGGAGGLATYANPYAAPAATGLLDSELAPAASDLGAESAESDWNPAISTMPEQYEMPTPAAPSVRTSSRPRRKPKSAVGEIIKVVLGGVAGLSITQLGLWWFANNDPFDLGKTLGASTTTRFIVPKTFWSTGEGAIPTPAGGVPTKPAAPSGTPTAGGGDSGFNSKVDWNSVVSGKEPARPAAKPAPAPSSELLVGNEEMPAEKPSDPLAFDLGNPLDLDAPGPAAKPAPTVDPSEPSLPDLDAPESPKPASVAKTSPDDPTFAEPASETPAPEKPTPEKPTLEKPTLEKPASAKPTDDPNETEPSTTEPSKPETSTPEPTKPENAKPENAKPENTESPAETVESVDVGAVVAGLGAAGQAWMESKSADKDARRKAADDLYAAFLHVSEALAKVDDNDEQLDKAVGEVNRHLASLTEDAIVEKALTRFGSNAFDATDRKTTAIALLGTVQGTKQEGSMFTTEIVVALKEPRTIRIVTSTDPLLEAGKKTLFLGHVVDTAADPIEDYTGEEGRVVLVRRPTFAWGE
jgi:hypothetical protein